MSRGPLDYAKALADRVTGQSDDILNDSVLEYGDKAGRPQRTASSSKPSFREVIPSSPKDKSIDVFLGLHYKGKTKELLNAIRFSYSGAPGDAGDKSWIQFASRRIIFESETRKTWSPAKLTSISTAASGPAGVPVTQGTTILWNVDSSSATDPHYSFEVEYTPDKSGGQMVDSPSFPPTGFGSAQDLFTRYSENEKVKAITMHRTMKTYLLRSDVAVWGCLWTSTIVCRHDDGAGWVADTNEYAIDKTKTNRISALDKEHADVLSMDYNGWKIF